LRKGINEIAHLIRFEWNHDVFTGRLHGDPADYFSASHYSRDMD